MEEPLDQGVDVLLRNERRFDVDLGELGLAVGAEVFVAEAPGDLDVAPQTRDLQQLFEKLWRLRQGIERLLVDPRRHQKVPRPFRGRSGEDRGLHLDEVHLVEVPSDGSNHLVAQHQVGGHFRSSQIEVAVGEPELLRGVGAVLDHKGRRLGGVENLEFFDQQFDLAARQFGIGLALGALSHGAQDLHHVFT